MTNTTANAGAPPAAGPAGLAATVAAWQGPLLRYAAQLMRQCPAEAEDVVQETFIKLHQTQTKGAEIRQLPSWLYRVTHNLAVDACRRRRAETAVADVETLAESPATPAATEALCRADARRAALAELERLPDRERQILLLKIGHGRTLHEVAEILGLAPSTVHYLLDKGLRQLARELTNKGAL